MISADARLQRRSEFHRGRACARALRVMRRAFPCSWCRMQPTVRACGHEAQPERPVKKPRSGPTTCPLCPVRRGRGRTGPARQAGRRRPSTRTSDRSEAPLPPHLAATEDLFVQVLSQRHAFEPVSERLDPLAAQQPAHTIMPLACSDVSFLSEHAAVPREGARAAWRVAQSTDLGSPLRTSCAAGEAQGTSRRKIQTGSDPPGGG